MGGMIKKAATPAAQAFKETLPPPAPAAKPAEQMAAEDKSARRRARRGGRSLLSDSRLNPEQGVATLGTTGL